MKSNFWPYGLFTSGQISAKVQASRVYNFLTWVIILLTINDLDNLWYVPLLLQEKLEEIDQTTLLVNFLLLVPGKVLLLASNYMISLIIRGGWCLMPRIDQNMEVRDTVIQQVLST